MSIAIKIIVPANNTSFNDRIKDAVAAVQAPDVKIDVESITGGTKTIQSRYDLSINTPYVIALAEKTQQDGYDGIFVTDFDMCGVEAVREIVNIPVVGGFRPSAYTAMMLAQRFSIITVLDNVVAMQREHCRAFGITENLASIRSVDMPVANLEDRDLAIAKVYEASIKAIEEDQAECCILGCTGFVGVAEAVAQLLQEVGKPAPVIDPNRAAVSYLELLIRNKLSQSRLTYYVPPDYTPPKLK